MLKKIDDVSNSDDNVIWIQGDGEEETAAPKASVTWSTQTIKVKDESGDKDAMEITNSLTF